MDILRCGQKLIIAVLFCMAFYFSSVHAQDQKLELYEQKIKAGLVYNLLKYTTWPESPGARRELQICLFGDDPFDGYLSPLEGRTAQQAPIGIKKVGQIAQTGDCSVVVIGRNQENNISALLQFLKGRHTLTISDIRHFTRQGGMVEMAKEGEKISLYINKSAVEKAGLDIGGRMLRLAKLVSG